MTVRTSLKTDAGQNQHAAAHVYRIDWRPGAPHPSHFVLVETEHRTIDDLIAALDAGLVACNELYFDRTDRQRWRLTGRVRCALRGDDVLAVHEAAPHVIAAMRQETR